MAVTININGLTLVHKDSGGVAKATLPDICLTPTSNGPVPRNYSNTAYSKDLAKGTVTITADGGHMCANKGSEFSKSIGDEGGSIGGIISGTHLAEATWITYSPNVFFEGKNVCRLSDKMLMNHGNTVCAAGVIVPPLKPPVDPKCKKIYERIYDALYAKKTGGSWNGKRGMAEMWSNYAQKGSQYTPRPDGSMSTRMKGHMDAYKLGQKNVKKELKSWKSKKSQCDKKSGDGDGSGEVIERAEAYANNKPEYGSGILEPPKSVMTEFTINLPKLPTPDPETTGAITLGTILGYLLYIAAGILTGGAATG
ncbi:MAG: DUF4150 domain-containing protein [Desulfobacteraceae bacterium]|nr:DUF4150 domain-containing protein [Desulfobacteraceae bacterium]